MLLKIAKNILVLTKTKGLKVTPDLLDVIIREEESKIVISTIIEHTHYDLRAALKDTKHTTMF